MLTSVWMSFVVTLYSQIVNWNIFGSLLPTTIQLNNYPVTILMFSFFTRLVILVRLIHLVVTTPGLTLIVMKNSLCSYLVSVTQVDYPTLYARSFRRRFFAYHHAVKHPHTSIILSWLSTPLVLKCATKILKIGLQIKIWCPKMFLNRDFA